MVIFLHMAGCQADLVTVRAVTGGSADSDLALRQFAGQGFFDRYTGVGRAGHTHSLINIGTSGKRVADSAAQTGSSTAEGFDLRRMVMGLVFEHYQPVLCFTVDLDRHNDRAGIDLFGNVQIIQLAFGAQFFHTDNGNIHQSNRALGSFAINGVTGSHILIKSCLDRFVIFTGLDLHVFDLRHKGSMAAVVGPVGIKNFDFSDSRLTVFFVKIFLAPQHIFQAHSQPHLLTQGFHLLLCQGQKAFQRLDAGWFFAGSDQGSGFLPLCLAGFDRIDAVAFDLVQISL